jgi:hypothetical protein
MNQGSCVICINQPGQTRRRPVAHSNRRYRYSLSTPTYRSIYTSNHNTCQVHVTCLSQTETVSEGRINSLVRALTNQATEACLQKKTKNKTLKNGASIINAPSIPTGINHCATTPCTARKSVAPRQPDQSCQKSPCSTSCTFAWLFGSLLAMGGGGR